VARGARLVLVEGLPGSGRGSTARKIAGRLQGKGAEVDTGRPARIDTRDPDYVNRTLDAWGEFLTASPASTRVVHGALFDGAIRGLYEQCMPEDEILQFWRTLETSLAPAGAVLVYLWHPDPACLIREHTIPTEGIDWYDRVADQVARTPQGRRFRHMGVQGFVEFWVHFGALCDSLVAQSRLPVERLPAAGQTMRDVLLPQ
jgi:hypothetical protein